MGNSLRRILAALALVGVASVGGAAPGTQADPSVVDLRNRLTQMRADLTRDPTLPAEPLTQMLTRHGLDQLAARLSASERALGPVPVAVAIPDHPATPGTSDLQIALTYLSQTHSRDDNRDVMLAPGTDPSEVLSFRGGTVTLADLDAAGALRRNENQQLELHRPVVLWDDTRLLLSPGEHLTMSRPSGAFLISFGQVEIIGAELSVTGGVNPHSAEFIPFLVIGGGGILTMEDSVVRGLGFRWTGKFSGVSIMAHPFVPAQGVSRIARSHFDRIVTLTLVGTPDVRVTDNVFHGARDAGMRISGGLRAQVQGNLFYGAGPTNAIRLLDASSHAVLAGNILMDGHRAGILVDRGSNHVKVIGNVIWRRDGSAIKVQRAQCGQVTLNIALDGQQKGIEVRTSAATLVRRNLISGTHSSAIWVSAQPKGAVTYLADNILSSNGQGLETATAARIAMSGNDLSAQLPRLISGDLVFQNAALAQDLTGQTPVVLGVGTQGQPIDVAMSCPAQGDKG